MHKVTAEHIYRLSDQLVTSLRVSKSFDKGAGIIRQRINDQVPIHRYSCQVIDNNTINTVMREVYHTNDMLALKCFCSDFASLKSNSSYSNTVYSDLFILFILLTYSSKMSTRRCLVHSRNQLLRLNSSSVFYL